jgi:hypothetical protein
MKENVEFIDGREWFLTSERLPEEGWTGWEITVQYKDGSRGLRFSYFSFEGNAEKGLVGTWMNVRKTEKVIAWREKPSPYRGPAARVRVELRNLRSKEAA